MSSSRLPISPQLGSSTDFTYGTYIERCNIHGRPLEVVCLTDRIGVCSHCAIFGLHKEHDLLPVADFISEIQQKLKHVESLRECHEKSGKKMTYEVASTSVNRDLVNKKTQILTQINNIFTQLRASLEQAHRMAIEEATNCIETLTEKCYSQLGEAQRAEQSFFNYIQKCIKIVPIISSTEMLSEKVRHYFESPLSGSPIGTYHLSNITESVEKSLRQCSFLIKSVRVRTNQKLESLIMNHVTLNGHADQQSEALDLSINLTTPPIKRESFNLKDTSNNETIKSISHQRNIFEEPKKLSSLINFSSKLSKVSSVKLIDIGKGVGRQADHQRKQSETSNRVEIERIVDDFCEFEKDSLDLMGFDLIDSQLKDILSYLREGSKRIRHLKLGCNKITNSGFALLMNHLPSISNLNLSSNLLTEVSVEILNADRKKTPNLRVLNLTNNKINERKVKQLVDDLKKRGIIVTL